MSFGIEVRTLSTAKEFVDVLRRSNSEWWENGQIPWVYRGHADERWKLLPSAWRNENPIMKICRSEARRRFEKANPNQRMAWLIRDVDCGDFPVGPNDDALQKLLSIETTAELLPIWDFVLRCDELGLSTPLSVLPPDRAENPDFLLSPNWPMVGDELLWQQELIALLALAQHHGLPTRLLDWTFDPIAAAFFAIEHLRASAQATDIAVWALHRQRASEVTTEGISDSVTGPIKPKLTVVRPTIKDNPYLAAQSGLFTTISGSGIYFMKNDGKRPDLEFFVSQAKVGKIVLRKFILPFKYTSDLADILHREGMSRAALMPTMDNIASDIRQRWLEV